MSPPEGNTPKLSRHLESMSVRRGNAAAFHVAEIFGASKPFTVLLRPDNYIGFILREPGTGGLRAYLSDVIRRIDLVA